MGRPIKKKFFGNLNNLRYGNIGTGSGVGGESVGLTVIVSNTGTHYSQGATMTFSAPQEPNATRATGTLSVAGVAAQGRVLGVAVTNQGNGYNSTATVSIVKPNSVTVLSTLTTTTSIISGITTTGIYVGMRLDGAPGMPANNYVTAIGTGTVTGTFNFTANTTTSVTFSDQGSGAQFITALTSGTQNAIDGVAYLLAKDGGSSAVEFDIVKQEASHRYLVKTSQGIGQCSLVAAAPTAGQMTIIATDANGNTYYVTKLTARRCRVVQKTQHNSDAWLVADGATTGWTINGASGTIVSIAHTA